MKKDFKFSVIIPIYNVENYLEETLLSVINQNIGFEENIQLVLVNDGSTDNSEKICLKYKELYPNNVIYKYQKNSGVSVARNTGIKLAEGEFINFLDSDDKWSIDSFKEVYDNYQKNPSIEIFSCKMIFFDGRKSQHPLNYKYKKNRIINILKDYTYPQLSSSSIFIKKELLSNKKYEKNIKYSEDNRLINEILFETKKYMVLEKPIYYYRRRADVSSAIQKQIYDKSYYLITPKYVYKYLFELSQKAFGRVIPYIQFLVLYDIQYRITIKSDEVLDEFENKEYMNIINELVHNIDDYIIMKNNFLDLSKKIFLLTIKYQKNYVNNIDFYENGIQFEGMTISNYKLGFLIIDNIYLIKNNLFIFGKLDTKFVDKKDFKVLFNDELIKVNFYELANDYNEKTYNDKYLHNYEGLSLEININNIGSIKFLYKDLLLIPRFKRECFLSEIMPNSYHNHHDKTIVFDNDCIIIKNKKKTDNIKYEIKNIKYLFKRKKYKSALIRISLHILKIFKRKKIMMISDRINVANDNGEAFYKYMVKNHKEYKTYFIISKNSDDYKRMKKIGKVLDNNSMKYKLLFQISDYIVSSHAETYIFKPLGNSSKYVQDQYYFKFVFLQHGITKDDLSPWLNVNNKKIDIFITAAIDEYNSILNYKYYYNKDIVKLTGFARYDDLSKKNKEFKKKKQILISFTWRNSLASKINSKTGEREYNNEFKNSNYFIFINKLINEPKLLKVLEKKGYTMKFCPHPNVKVQINDFKLNNLISIDTGEIDYQKEFCENALLITDYSSVFFDFAYLKNPVIYAQFDKEEFYKTQLYDKGYFDYEKSGFGPVCKDYNETVDVIIKSIEADCPMEEKYLKRINSFFAYNDSKNCERIYNEIKKI